MPIGTTNRAQLAYIAETVWGTTPGTGSMKIARYTGESLDNNYTFTESAEIIADRMTTDIVRTGGSSAGDVNYELSYGMFDDWIEAALCGTWTTNVVRTGTTMRSFTVEKQFLDVPQFLAFTGQRVDTWRMELRQGQIASGSFGFMGKASNAMAGVTVRAGTTAAPTDSVMAPVDSIQTLTEGGSTIGGCSALTFNLSNSLRPLPVINSIDPRDINAGRQRITGTLDMYFEDATAYAKFRSQTETALVCRIGGSTTKNYNLNFPRVKFTKATVTAGGGDQDMMVAFEWTALRHAGTTSLLEITRQP